MSLAGFPLLAEQIADLRSFSANPQQRIPWGIPSLDLITEGPAPGEVFMVMGRSFTGKSLVATNLMVNNVQFGGIFFSLEMPARQAIQRLYATWAGVDHREVQAQTRQNRLPHHLDLMGEELAKQVVVDQAALSLGDMSAYLSSYDSYFGERPRFVVIDYLELIGGSKNTAEGWVRTEATASSLKDWAKDEAMPVFVLHQTNKQEKEYAPPTADSARGAGYTEADCVVGMWNPGRNPEISPPERMMLDGHIYFNVLKNRVTGRLTRHDAPIRTLLREDLRLVDLTQHELRRVS